jgi:hypothetical protein
MLTGKIARLVRIDKSGGAVFEFWVEMPGGGGAVRAIEAIAAGFREGDEVVVEGNRSPEGVLDAVRISRVVARQPSRPRWLLPPYRLLLFVLPLTALVAYAIVAAYSVQFAVGRAGRADRAVLFLVLGVGLYTYARARIRHVQLRAIAMTAGATFVVTALGGYLLLTSLLEMLVIVTLAAAVAGAVLVVAFALLDHKRARKATPPSTGA